MKGPSRERLKEQIEGNFWNCGEKVKLLFAFSSKRMPESEFFSFTRFRNRRLIGRANVQR